MPAPLSRRSAQRPSPAWVRSPLSLAIATSLCLAAAPALAADGPAPAPTASHAVERAIDTAFQTTERAQRIARLPAAARVSARTPLQVRTAGHEAAVHASSGVAAIAPADTGTAATGSFHLADGGRTDDLEIAAASWRDDAEFQGDWGLQAIGAEYAYARGITGAGVALGILDSGVLDTHPEFAGDGKLTLLDTRDGIWMPDDERPGEYGDFDGRPLIGYTGYSDHGTHVGGTMVANRDGNGMHGVAFGASLHSATHFLGFDSYVVLRGGQISPTVASVDAFVESGARFVNHSWGSANDALLHDAPREDVEALLRPRLGAAEVDAFRRAAEADVVQVFAAGNIRTAAASGTGPHASSWGSAPMFFPELEQHWVVVTNMQPDEVTNPGSYYCGHARYWCVTAPGTGITSSTITQTLSERHEQIRVDAAESTEPFTRAELFTEVIALQDYVAPLGEFYVELLSMEADQEAITALVDELITRAARVAGMLQRYDMSGEPPGNQSALALYRDNPTVFLDRLNNNIADTLLQLQTLAPQFLLEQDVTIAFQSAVNAAFGDLGYEASYGAMNGTSMAAPHVTGALGLVAERFGYMTSAQVRDTLLTTAGDPGEALSDEYGWGLISLEGAMQGPGAFLVDFDVTLPAGVDDTWSNDITNALVRTGREDDRGGLIKRGAGSLTLAGDNSFDGFTVHEGLLTLSGDNAFDAGFDGVVDGGGLSLSGSLQGNALRVHGGIAEVTADGRLDGADLFVGGADGAAVALVDGLQTGASTWVGDNGRLGGTGTLGDTTVAAGGTVAPGRSIGTLTVDGDYVQQAGSFFEVEMTPPDQVDRLAVTGTATLEGGTVVAQRGPGVYALGEQYDFLTADGGIVGRFDALDTTAITPFLGLSLAYGADGVVLDVTRGASFASVADTHNRRAAAGGLDALSDGNALVGSLVQLFPEDAIAAVDVLSGDVHATAQSVLIDTSRHLRGTALARAGGGTDPLQAQQDPDRRFGAWVDIQRHGGRLDGDGNAAGTEYNGGNTLVGADYTFDNGLRLGVLGGIGESDLKARERQHARTDLDARYVGVYAGYAWQGLGLRGGWTHGRHDVEVERPVRYAGFEARPYAAYDATTRQAFVEAGYRFGNDQWGVEPYAQFAQVRVSADAFTESGGAAALSGQTRDVRADLTTGGVRFDVNLKGSQQEETWVGLRGGVGYRKTGGELVPWTDVAFAGGDSFTVHGARVASDATLVELGVAARTSANSLLEVGYQGQYASEARDHGANLRWSLQF
ncbi:autotransporter domain-containing protein [Luteimonas abyssi]|uniref:autotransporter domain-containing protein n=1 Tax=Luteimonas abyssi TaxID=1247514 RepID=UPI000737D016|nr:autotransporter domain-containing protein [Luteimonas abyssi]